MYTVDWKNAGWLTLSTIWQKRFFETVGCLYVVFNPELYASVMAVCGTNVAKMVHQYNDLLAINGLDETDAIPGEEFYAYASAFLWEGGVKKNMIQGRRSSGPTATGVSEDKLDILARMSEPWRTGHFKFAIPRIVSGYESRHFLCGDSSLFLKSNSGTNPVGS